MLKFLIFVLKWCLIVVCNEVVFVLYVVSWIGGLLRLWLSNVVEWRVL